MAKLLLSQGVQRFDGWALTGTNPDPQLFREPNSNKKYKIAGNLNKKIIKRGINVGRNTKMLDESKGNLTREQQENKKNAEKALNDLQELENKPPDWLDATAKEEFNRIYPLLQELPVKSIDLALVSSYCQAYSDHQRASIELRSGETVTFTERGSKVNPWHRVKVDSFNIMNSIAPKLGMSIDSRMKIFTPKTVNQKTDDPVEEFF